MSYWWVNQNQTFDEETNGGYLWSPQRKKDGSRNPFYDTMTRVRVGDLVFSFSDTYIKALGVATTPAYKSSKPTDFGTKGANWSQAGWRVDVTYYLMDAPVRPKSHIEDIRPHLPEKYSPLMPSGDGKQSVYLAEVPTAMAEMLLRKLREAGNRLPLMQTPDDEAVTSITVEEERVRQILDDARLPETEKQQIVLARRGQGRFRTSIRDRRCRVTGIGNETYLRASHIKPWRDADNAERLDGENGLLLAPHVDFLFDKGLITFEDDGRLVISPRADSVVLSLLGIHPEAVVVVAFRDQQREYLRYHREQVFRS